MKCKKDKIYLDYEGLKYYHKLLVQLMSKVASVTENGLMSKEDKISLDKWTDVLNIKYVATAPYVNQREDYIILSYPLRSLKDKEIFGNSMAAIHAVDDNNAGILTSEDYNRLCNLLGTAFLVGGCNIEDSQIRFQIFIPFASSKDIIELFLNENNYDNEIYFIANKEIGIIQKSSNGYKLTYGNCEATCNFDIIQAAEHIWSISGEGWIYNYLSFSTNSLSLTERKLTQVLPAYLTSNDTIEFRIRDTYYNIEIMEHLKKNLTLIGNLYGVLPDGTRVYIWWNDDTWTLTINNSEYDLVKNEGLSFTLKTPIVDLHTETLDYRIDQNITDNNYTDEDKALLYSISELVNTDKESTNKIIDTFKEITNFLEGYDSDDLLKSIIDSTVKKSITTLDNSIGVIVPYKIKSLDTDKLEEVEAIAHGNLGVYNNKLYEYNYVLNPANSSWVEVTNKTHDTAKMFSKHWLLIDCNLYALYDSEVEGFIPAINPNIRTELLWDDVKYLFHASSVNKKNILVTLPISRNIYNTINKHSKAVTVYGMITNNKIPVTISIAANGDATVRFPDYGVYTGTYTINSNTNLLVFTTTEDVDFTTFKNQLLTNDNLSSIIFTTGKGTEFSLIGSSQIILNIPLTSQQLEAYLLNDGKIYFCYENQIGELFLVNNSPSFKYGSLTGYIDSISKGEGGLEIKFTNIEYNSEYVGSTYLEINNHVFPAKLISETELQLELPKLSNEANQWTLDGFDTIYGIQGDGTICKISKIDDGYTLYYYSINNNGNLDIKGGWGVKASMESRNRLDNDGLYLIFDAGVDLTTKTITNFILNIEDNISKLLLEISSLLRENIFLSDLIRINAKLQNVYATTIADEDDVDTIYIRGLSQDLLTAFTLTNAPEETLEIDITTSDGRMWYLQRMKGRTLENTNLIGRNFNLDGTPTINETDYPGVLIFTSNASTTDFTDTEKYK